jgi:hypothetical protein
MRQRWLYLSRAVPWTALLGCCAAALLVTLLVGAWPSSALVLLPALVACCAAAAAFAFDEVTLPVVEVTPRGATWRRTARFALASVPLLVWSAVVWARPGDVLVGRLAWWTVGAAAILLAVGLAAVASRWSVPSPGSMLASGIVLSLVGVVVVAMFLGLDPVYPYEGSTGSSRGFWATVAGAGVLACVVALRPGLRR